MHATLIHHLVDIQKTGSGLTAAQAGAKVVLNLNSASFQQEIEIELKIYLQLDKWSSLSFKLHISYVCSRFPCCVFIFAALVFVVDRYQSLFYFVPQILTVKLARLLLM